MRGTKSSSVRCWPAIAVMTATVVLAGGPAANAKDQAARNGPFFDAPFKTRVNSYTFGQAPTWTRDGRVLSSHNDRAGISQVYRSKLDGSASECLTCGRIKGPNGFAVERAQGDWIMFCSMGQQTWHLGGDCLGGYGSDLYVMKPNGKEVTRLTVASDPNHGADYSQGGTPYDNYHPYWSPNGRHVVWTRTIARPLGEGGQTWEMMLADFFVSKSGTPSLGNVRVVGPAFGVYETQHWAPDGSGFLFTAFGPRNSPFQKAPPGWMHQVLYFMRLYGKGASPSRPMVTQLSDDLPVYQEQAIFTPDMRSVIFMSNRNAPNGSWYDHVIAAAMRTGFDAPYPGSVGGPQFLADFLDPAFRSDLFMLDVRTRDLRQLTDFHGTIPEFDWNHDFTKLLWSGPAGRNSGEAARLLITRTGTFTGVTRIGRRPPTKIPAPGLYGQPIDMNRLKSTTAASAAAPRRVHALSISAPPIARAAGQNPRGTLVNVNNGDRQTIPPVALDYVVLWLNELRELGTAAGDSFTAPPLSVTTVLGG